MQIKLHTSIPETTIVTNTFIDTYMAEASGSFLKVYLYVLRWQQAAHEDLSLTEIADHLYMTESDVMCALKYWQNKKLLSFDSEDSGQPKEAAPVSQPAPSIPTPEVTAPPAKKQYSMDEICAFCEANNENHLLFVLQQYLKHPLTQAELNSVLFFHEGLGFSTDLIEYLFEYCASLSHHSIHYIEKVALGWAEQGIQTVAEAKARSNFFTKTDYAVLKALGINNRNPVEAEVESIRRWTDQYGFSPSVVLEACKRTMAAIHTPSFSYIEKILKNWHDQGLFSLESIQKADHKRKESKKDAPKDAAASTADAVKTAGTGAKKADSKNRFNHFNQRSYDYESLEQKLAQKLNQNNQ